MKKIYAGLIAFSCLMPLFSSAQVSVLLKENWEACGVGGGDANTTLCGDWFFREIDNTRTNVVSYLSIWGISGIQDSTDCFINGNTLVLYAGLVCNYAQRATTEIRLENRVPLDLTQYGQVKVEFDWIGVGEAGADYGNFIYSYDGITWQTEGLELSGSATVVWNEVIDLSAVADGRPNFYVGWQWINDDLVYAPPGISIDNITVTGVKQGPDFTAPNIVCTNDPVQFTDVSPVNPTSWNWSASPSAGVTITNPTDQNPTFEFANPGTYDITLSIDGPAGPQTETKTAYIQAQEPVLLPLSEDFSNRIPNDWLVINPDGGTRWATAVVTGRDGSPGRSAYMASYSYGSVGARDYLITPPMDFSVYDSAFLSFNHAYAPDAISSPNYDSLIVSVSPDCGTTWERVLVFGEDGTGTFATQPATPNTSFIPADSSEWCGNGTYGPECVNKVDLSQYAGNRGVRVRFEWVNQFSNNGYIDDILIEGVSSEIAANFEANPILGCLNSPVQFTDLSNGNPVSWDWAFEGGNPDSSDQQNPSVTYTTAGTYDVELIVCDGNGNCDTLVRPDYITIEDNKTIPFFEDWESGGFTANSWRVENPQGGENWEVVPVGGDQQGTRAVSMSHFNDGNIGNQDLLISPGLDLSGFDSVSISFDHAYAVDQLQPVNDTLLVEVSPDCGASWDTLAILFDGGSNPYSTAEVMLEEFTPSNEDDWCFGPGSKVSCYALSMKAYAGLKGVRIRFRSINNNGNNTFIDNILVDGVGAGIPEANFTATPRFVCPGSTVQFKDLSTGGVTSWDWSFPGGNPDSSDVKNPQVVYSQPGVYPVTLIVSNALGTDIERKNSYIRVSEGFNLPFVEDFESSTSTFEEHAWAIDNPDNDNTFKIVTTAGTSPGNKSLKIDLFNNTNIGSRDFFESPPLNFGDWDSVSFSFEHAYRPTGATSSPDTLIVQLSEDCGSSWITLETFVHTGPGTFGTVAPGTGEFTPSQASDWCLSGTSNTPCASYDLSSYIFQNQLKVRFIVVNGGGNNIFLDNINISGYYVGEPPVAAFESEYPIACVGETVQFFDRSENRPASYEWSFPGGTPSQSNGVNPQVTYSQPGLYSVALIAKNFFGNDTTIVQDYIKVVEPRLLPFTENFETGDFGTNDWYTVSPGGGKKWRIDTASGNGGSLAAVFKHFNNGNGVGEYDHLVSPPFNLSGYDSVMLDFEHAYQVYSTSAIDSLVVSYSTDCGSDWNRIASYGDDGSGSFATLLPSQTEFTPTKLADWCLSGTYGASCIGFDLTDETAGLDNVKFRFTTYSDGGNNLFIDNINITGVSSVPTANFKGDTTVICQNDSVLFINTSTPNATDFLWDFDGGMPGTSTDADPGYVTYDTPGLYTISLQASNQAGSDSRTKIDYIQVIPSPELSFTVVPAGCGQSNGSATVNVSGGMPPFTYVWDRIPASDTNATLSGAVGGTYSVTVTGANGCSTTAPVLINTSGNMQASIVQYKAVTCNGDADGALTAKGSLGLAPYTYEWNTGETSSSISGLSGGRYTCVVRDAAGCVQSVSTVVQEPGLLQVSLTGRNDDGSTNGQVNASVSGGTQPYTYVWNTGDSTASLDSLGQGLYTVNITDKNGCKVSAQYIVSYQPEITIHLDDLTNVSCNGQQDGSISVSASGGTAPYNFQWNTAPPQFTPTATGLGVGNYTVTVTDQLGVTQTMTVFVSEESPIVLNASATDDDGTMNGTATATVFSGGVPPYTFHWNTSPPQTTQTITALQEGFYMVTVTDSAGCTAAQTVQVVGSYQALNVNPNSVVDLKCNGDNDGSAEVNVSGGVPPYDYLWTTTPAQFTPKATNLSGGTYWVYVTDAYDNVDSLQVTVNEPAAMGCLVSSSPDDGSGNQGSATVNPFGGTPFPGNPQYSYSWDTQPVQLSQTATGLLPGFYTVTVTDANGCVCQATVEVDHDGTGVSQEELSEYIQVYPNPNSGRFNIALTLPKATDVDVIMTDGIGKRVYYQNHGKLGHDQIGMDIDNLPKGVYHLSIVSPEWQYNTRVVISD